jgi:phosphoglycolate phosphatase-like HAD superfamily hydrolase
MLKKVAFDLDGTLITTDSKQSLLMKSICIAFDVPFNVSLYWNLKRSGFSNPKALAQLGVPAEKIDKICTIWKMQIENPYWQGFDNVIPGSIGLLEQLARNGTSSYLVTARSDVSLLNQQLQRLNLGGHFAGVYAVNPSNAAEEKAKILQNVGVELFIGDSEVDFLAARAAGVTFFGVESGQRTKVFLAGQGVTFIGTTAASVLEFAFIK